VVRRHADDFAEPLDNFLGLGFSRAQNYLH
jgi:hypothetical protein